MNADQGWAIGMLAAGGFYALGVSLATGILNVPLSNGPDRIQAEDEASAEIWRRYLKTWTRWNHIRTALAVLSIVLFAYVLLQI